MTKDEIELLRNNRCPKCRNWGFIPGPRGGAGQNIFCSNPECKAAYAIAPRHDIQIAQEVGTAPDHYYPPQVHCLHGTYGQPLPMCNFIVASFDSNAVPRLAAVPPDAWPIGHAWVTMDDKGDVTCKACREVLKGLPKGKGVPAPPKVDFVRGAMKCS